MKFKKILMLLNLLLILAAQVACSYMPTAPWNKEKEAGVGVVPYHPDSLWNLKMGREYAASGRYELAREHYLLAMASANNAELRGTLNSELQSVDLMIRTQR